MSWTSESSLSSSSKSAAPRVRWRLADRLPLSLSEDSPLRRKVMICLIPQLKNNKNNVAPGTCNRLQGETKCKDLPMESAPLQEA